MGLLGYFVSKGSGRFNITLGAIGTAVGILTSSCQRQEKRTFSTRTYEYDIFIFEYCLAVPANRLGFVQFSGFQLKIIQEVITISSSSCSRFFSSRKSRLELSRCVRLPQRGGILCLRVQDTRSRHLNAGNASGEKTVREGASRSTT